MKKLKKLYYIFLPFIVLLLAVGIVVDILYPMFKQVIAGGLGTVARADDEYVAAALENSKNVNIELQEEGTVLLKNDGVLPLAPTGSTPINVYGIMSAHHYLGGSGSGASNSTGTDLKTALESVGFKVNDSLWNLMASKKVTSSSSNINEGTIITEAVAEIPLDEYNGALTWANAKANSEYAIVTIGRGGAEGSDLGRSILELGTSEIALLQKLHEEGFKVITLINSSNVIELGPVQDYSDAILWIGGTGLYGAYGVANLISGKANPSARLVDTWMYEQETSSSYYTTINTESNFILEGDAKQASLGAYTNYNEGIYVGYRWYETADAEGYWDGVSNKYGTGYDGVVAYPFGYGLSYTQFNERITEATHENGQFTFTIKAENTGSVAGKDVIELYVEKPYTNGGVEVAKVELAAFDKTEKLAGGGEGTITLTVNEEDLASYNSSANNGKGCYVLAGGEYKFYLASAETGAHIWATASGEERVRSFVLDGTEYVGENKRSGDAVAAVNLLEVTDNDTGIASNDGTAGFNELSRKDHFANAAQTISEQANSNGKVAVASGSDIYRALTQNYGGTTYSNYNKDHLASVAEFTDPSVGQKKQYSLADLYTTDKDGNPLYEVDGETGERTVLGKVDYDDPRWDVLISQMTLEEMSELIGRGGYGNIAIGSIDKIPGYDYDGPTGYSNFLKANLNIEQETTGFCSEPIMAATWNVELVEEYGKAVGREGNAFSNTGWYAPGMNIHRTAFGGRLGEYFSEDTYLTGMMGASVAYGAFEMGIYTYAKHFAFNEIETQRDKAMNCWISEQAAREIYLRPFEIAIKQGKLTGLMSSFMYLNAQWNGGDYNLMSGIVRGEWNFKGVINTDLAGQAMMGAGRALCAGTDMLLTTSYVKNASGLWQRCDDIQTTDAGVCAMKTAAKHILFAYASAQLNREVAAKEADTTMITVLYVLLNVIGYGGAAVLAGLFAWRLVLDLKKDTVELTDGTPDENGLPEEGQ